MKDLLAGHDTAADLGYTRIDGLTRPVQDAPGGRLHESQAAFNTMNCPGKLSARKLTSTIPVSAMLISTRWNSSATSMREGGEGQDVVAGVEMRGGAGNLASSAVTIWAC